MLKPLVIALSALVALPAAAGPFVEPVAKCLADNTTGKDRKNLARWIFVAMAAHPEIRDLANASRDAGDQTSRETAQLFTRLLAESCAKEVQALIRNEGSQSLRAPFETLGQLAMQELMTNRDVLSAVGAFERYVDRARISAVLEAK